MTERAIRAGLMVGSTVQPLIRADLDAIGLDDVAWEVTQPKPGRRFLAPRRKPPKVFKW